jgi:hypothetical protein
MADQKEINRLQRNEMYEVGPNANPSLSGEVFFEIHIKGQLNSHWSDWLEGLEVKILENGEMILFGPIVDQSALMGVLNKLSRLNLTLISFNEVKDQEKETK